MYGYIYLTTNLINNKQYIGKHKSDIFDPTYKGSGKYLKLAFQKHGKDNFKVELLEECNDLTELNEKEIYWISKYNAVNSKQFYNVSKGGDNGIILNQILINNGNISKYIPKTKLNFYLTNGWVKGLKPGRSSSPKSFESRVKMSITMTGKKHDGNWNINQKQSKKL